MLDARLKEKLRLKCWRLQNDSSALNCWLRFGFMKSL